jgi:hypothetical protein
MFISEILQEGSHKKCRPRIFHIICDQCRKEYTINYSNWKKGVEKYNRDLCRSCKQKEQYKSGKRSKDQCFKGGKKSKEKLEGKSFKELFSEEKYVKIKEKISKLGNLNPMYGKSDHTFGLKKYSSSIKGNTFDEIHGEKRSNEIKQKISRPGKLNPMYGKPSPIGSGNGWSGWYKGWYFRSLHELSYMIYVIERFNLVWKSAERNELKIEYLDWNRKKRTYVADFLIGEKYLVEIKPKKLHGSKLVNLKKEAAIKFCLEKKLTYKLTNSSKLLSYSELKNLIDSGEVELIERYKAKYKQIKNNIL